MLGPQTEAAENLHAMKYRLERETFRDFVNRLALALRDNDAHYHELRPIFGDQRFMPAGRIQAAAGSGKNVTYYNCLSGDTKILTREFGSIEIEKISGKDVTLLDGNREWVKCHIHDHGEQLTYAMNVQGGFENAIVRSTPEHGWVRKTQGHVITTRAFIGAISRCEIDDLRPQKIVENQERYEAGLMHGVIYGDGTHNGGNNYLIRVCSSHDQIEPILKNYPHSYPPSNNGDPCYYINSKLKLKEFPDIKDLDYLLGFLRGWFAADGCVSAQPHATLCGDKAEMDWIGIWGPLVGWHIRGASKLSSKTNFGVRKKISLNIHLKSASMCNEDFLLDHHRARWNAGHNSKRGKGWRVRGSAFDPKIERVYCPVVPTTHSFALSNGIHSRNCFVSGTLDDSMEGILKRFNEAMWTMRMGGGIGYDFSTLRPKGELIKSLMSVTGGPMAFMPIFDAGCKAIASAGHRRGAQMGVMRVDHPDIIDFINAKHDNTTLSAFNVSIAVTDAFMEALEAGKNFTLKFGGKDYREIDARELWEMVMRGTWDFAEPGILAIDTINRMNNLYYCETIAATNPCGEQSLPPYGACLLGSINLPKYLTKQPISVTSLQSGERQPGYYLDIEQIERDMPAIVRAMDNVVDRSLYPLPEQQVEAVSKRRMGLGVTGLANALEALGLPYGTPAFIAKQGDVLRRINIAAYKASALLAKEKGAFPLYDCDLYAASKFIKSDALDDETRDLIKRYGIRNSHLTSIAPTGTISQTADNISSGVEPVFSLTQQRAINTPDGAVIVELQDYGLKFLGVRGKESHEVTPDEHVDVLTTAQKYVDSAVSKTCNVDENCPWPEFKGIYEKAIKAGCKGVTTFNSGGKRMALLKSKSKSAPADDGDNCKIDFTTGRRECS